MSTKGSEFDGTLKTFQVLQTADTAFRNQVEISLPAANSATKRDDSIFFDLLQKFIDVDLLKERKFGLKRHLDGMESKLLSLKVECASLRWGLAVLNTLVAELDGDLGSAQKAVLQHSSELVAQMSQVFGVPLANSLKHL